MESLYLNRLSRQAYQELVDTLWAKQVGKCFICEDVIDRHLHAGSVDVDHIEPPRSGGKDDSSNFALCHAHCNRSKQASDLRIARLLARFERVQQECVSEPGRPNLSDILAIEGGARFELPIRIENGAVAYSFPDLGDHQVHGAPLCNDVLSGMDYFFAELPVAYLFHDDRINPRAIAQSSLRKLLEEFHSKLPQLHVTLAWIRLDEGTIRTQIRVFDGQHKAAAQVMLGVKRLPVRVFVNPDTDVLLTANTHAGTTLGSSLYNDLFPTARSKRLSMKF